VDAHDTLIHRAREEASGKEDERMHRTSWMWLGFMLALAVGLTALAGWAGEQAQKPKTELPAAVAKAVKDNFPTAEIDKVDVEKSAGISLYDIEFKGGKGEIEVAQDGTVIDVATIVDMKDIPKPAAEALQKAAVGGVTIKQVERSEVRAEVKNGKVVRLASPKYVYAAELVKGKQTGEMQVAPDGKVVEALKWSTGAQKKGDKGRP
jgi:hypothetical protein